MEKYKCAWIENMISIETDGFTRPCCLENSTKARIADASQGLVKAFNHEKLIKLRDNLSTGFTQYSRSFCHRCEELENRGQKSLRNMTPFLSESRELKMIQFKLSNRCQLACFHCGPDQSSTYAKKFHVKPIIKDSIEISIKFLNELSELLPTLSIIKFTGGEPFLDKNHWKILEYLKKFNRKHCELQYITNGVTPFNPELWEGWKSINCSVSVDGYEESYEWFRRGSSWEKILSGVSRLKKYSDISINYSLTPFTVQDYIKSKDFWKFNITAIPIVSPSYSSLINFPKSIVQNIKDYDKIPFNSYSEDNNIDIYVERANKWDSIWNTPGWADRLFYWVKEYNDRN